jgi:hypothetical protein
MQSRGQEGRWEALAKNIREKLARKAYITMGSSDEQSKTIGFKCDTTISYYPDTYTMDKMLAHSFFS